tara:strand:- start:1180 stop:2571 length:1392 start_codon:yes stop_codon:yes gene_type:complete
MSKNKNQAIWKSRIKKKTSSLFQKVGSSINIDKELYKEDIKVSIVHVEMLFRQKIISFKVKNKIIYGLNKIEREISGKKFQFNKKFEDIHMNIEKRLFEIIGEDAGYLHTARSRNDQVITDFKIWMRSSVTNINKKLDETLKSLLVIAQKNIKTVMPGLTHLKNAQPVSFAHYLLAYLEMFKRDKKRFLNNLESLSENPLGVAALTGTSFNIDRNFTTKKLGFKKPTNNSIDTVSDRDFVLDYLFNISVCSMHISRVAEELIIWNSDGFKMIGLSDKIVTGSSIMPQKKNPDLLEYLRGKSGTSFGNLFSMLTILKGLPLSYFKDLQDDKEIVFKSNETINNCLSIFNEILKNFYPNKQIMLRLAEEGFTTATDFADYLVKKHDFTFRNAYHLTGTIVNYAEKKKKKLSQLSLKELQKLEPKLDSEVLKIFDLSHSVNSKKSFGGTSFDNIKKMLTRYRREIK